MDNSGLAIVTILALIEYSVLGFMVGRARQKFGVAAPATTGNPEFERYFRVHQNTLESLIVFLPSLWIFAFAASYSIAVLLGLAFIVGRAIYAAGYIQEPGKREAGAIVTFAANGILSIGALIALIIRVL
ncbi:MAG TPA: MAPEG family protein [Candidatus Binataceae bacterium]|nr:MAPEG family protein [Candidatus Binataceae bacterium]